MHRKVGLLCSWCSILDPSQVCQVESSSPSQQMETPSDLIMCPRCPNQGVTVPRLELKPAQALCVAHVIQLRFATLLPLPLSHAPNSTPHSLSP